MDRESVAERLSRREALGMLGAVGAVGLAGCGTRTAAGQSGAAQVSVIPNGNFITDANGNGPPFGDGTLLFDPGPESIPLNEIVATDDEFGARVARPLTDSRRLVTRPPRQYDREEGYDESWEPVTWDEYEQVSGEVTLDFDDAAEEGTLVDVSVQDGIPNGRYTMWAVKFAELTDPEAFDAFVTPNGNGLVGFHNLGPKSDDRSEADNVFVTDGTGSATLSRRNEGGSLTGIPGFRDPGYPFVGAVDDYRQDEDELTRIDDDLREEDEIHFVGAYHYDDQTWGVYPGPYHVNHFDVRFQF